MFVLSRRVGEEIVIDGEIRVTVVNDSAGAADPSRSGGLWRNRGFLKLWAGQTISDFGSLVSAVALPFAAIIGLKASPWQMALLRAAGACRP